MKCVTLILLLSLCFFSCEKIILGEDERNSPENNFELLWSDLDRSYSLFQARNINWQELYDEYRPQVNSNTSNEELWDVFTQLLEHLNDSHVTLFSENENSFFISGYALNEQSKKEYSKELITGKYLEFRIEIESEDNLSYGRIKNEDIGYIYLGEEGGENPAVIDEIIDVLKYHKAIIVDVRQNTGGDDRYSHRISGVFANSEKIVYSVQTRNGINHDDFDKKTFYSTEKEGDVQFIKPVILLTDRRTISAGEIFCLQMKSFEHVTQIGDTTAGDFATTGNRSFLPNGWSYKYPVQLFLRPNGDYLDGNGGNVPDIYMKNSESDILSNVDKVLEAAIAFLNG